MTKSTAHSVPESGTGRLVGAAFRWAEVSGDKTAISAPDGVLTFAELAHRVRALTAKFAAEGIGPGTAVGFLLGRSVLGLPSLLALWRLGATAVLLDERHPVDRLNFVLRDAGAQVLLADRLPAGAAPRRARIVRPEVSGADTADPLDVSPDGCAYIVYTSGTTGWPKGVEVTYGNLGAFLDALATLGLPPGGMGINAVSPAFDGWIWCALLYLLHGQGMALVDLSPQDMTVDPAELLARPAPTTICLTPTLLSALERLPRAELVVVAGEHCPPGLLARLTDVPRVLNVYGPTETTVAATWADTARGDDPATIGRPLPGYSAYVLDGHGQPVPAGGEGELHIGGPAVARGYRNRPELTAERFILDPFSGRGARMYRTGDVVRVRPDGQLEFRGRADDQVKVRGFRIELGEIERTAAQVGSVRAAAAFTLPGGDSLGLGVTATGAISPAECAEQVKEHCRRRLPHFMVPATVQVLPMLPALPTGKVDRRALALAADAWTATRPPRTQREREVCAVWSELLSRPVNDIGASFFELGGYSLLAARAVAALRRKTGLPLSMRHLLADPTPTALASQMDLLAAERQDAG